MSFFNNDSVISKGLNHLQLRLETVFNQRRRNLGMTQSYKKELLVLLKKIEWMGETSKVDRTKERIIEIFGGSSSR